MAYDDTKWGGFAKIIVDTSTMTVGDTVRVKSVTTGTNYDKQVVTVGTPLIWETDIYKDYVKICMVQTINDTPTEIGGVYRTVDYGQTLFINVLDKTTLGGIQGILNAHQEGDLLAIGDEVPILVGGSSWIMQVGDIDTTNHAVHFVSKYIYSKASNYYDYKQSNVRTAMQGFYANIDNNDKRYIKEVTRTASYGAYDDYVWCLGAKEVDGINGVASQHQFPIFTMQSNRIKTYQGNATDWWTQDYQGGSVNYYITPSGTTSTYNYGSALGIVPCFTLIADS